jgi:hypothetical protein
MLGSLMLKYVVNIVTTGLQRVKSTSGLPKATDFFAPRPYTIVARLREKITGSALTNAAKV